jgi:hypothetical protein
MEKCILLKEKCVLLKEKCVLPTKSVPNYGKVYLT